MAEELAGIANYCFRWCERCPFTNRCGVYALGRQTGSEDLKPANLPRAFPALSGFYRTFLARLDRQLGPDGESVTSLEQKCLTVEELKNRAKRWVVSHLNGSVWIMPLLRSADFTLPAVQAAHVFNFYTVVLGSKLQRVLRSHEICGDDSDDFHYVDARRTAYLVLLILARTTAALTVLLEKNAGPRDRLLTRVQEVSAFSASLRKLFPDVSLFARPYWDAEPWLSEQRAFYAGHPPLHPFREGLWSFHGSRAPEEI